MLVVPAAGIGSRLGSTTPKFLVPVLGRPMIDWLADLCRPYVSTLVVVVNPQVASLTKDRAWPENLRIEVRTQENPTGMLDAVLLGRDAAQAPTVASVWVMWCDQVAIAPSTVRHLATLSVNHPDAAIVMPTLLRDDPYIHFDRDPSGRIVGVRQRREGDAMPARGESDAGLFSFSRQAFLDWLPEYGRTVVTGNSTGERNLLPFIPWAASRAEVVTFPCTSDIEAVGINTPDDLRAVEQALARRDRE